MCKQACAKMIWTILIISTCSVLAKVDTQSYPGQVVFLGDSITDFWRQNGWQPWAEHYEPLGAVNTGVAGDLTTNTITRINDEGIIDNLNSRIAVLLIGTNDLAWGGLNEEQVYNNIGHIMNLIRQKNPGCKILLLGVLPRAEADIHTRIRNLNELISNYANGSDVFYLDMQDAFSTGLGQVIPGLYSDGVHLTGDGYLRWSATMNPLFFEILNGESLPTVSSGPTTSTTLNPNQGQVVFLGDSITDSWRYDGLLTWNEFYAPLGAVNMGVSGDLTTNTIQRINDGILESVQSARMAVLKIGTNDLSYGIPDDDVVANIGTILDLIRQKIPGVSILLLGILPRAPASIDLHVRFCNFMMASYALPNDVWFLDMADAFAYDFGMVYPELYTADYLHLNSQGYVKWAETMNPTFFSIVNSIK